jgi:hypothetical protein
VIPVKTLIGLYKKKDLNKIFKKKKIIIWGTGPVARETFCSLQGHKIKVSFFINNKVSQDGHYFLNKKILNFNNFEKLNFKKYFIIVAATEYRKQANQYLEENLNLKKEIDFCNWLKFARPHAIINFIKKDGLKYSKIYNKIKKSIPFISKIEIWFSEKYISKNINYKDFLIGDKTFLNSFNIKMSQHKIIKKFKKLRNSQIYLHMGDEVGTNNRIVRDYHEIYNELSKKNSIFNNENLKKNLNFYIYESKILNKNKIHKIVKILKRKKISFWMCSPYIMPYDKVLNNLKKFNNIKNLKQIFKYYNFKINDYLKLSLKSKKKPCLSQRVYPVIDNNNTLKHCSLYEKPILSNNAMNSNLLGEMRNRSNNQFCKKCQFYALHRFDIKILDKEYAEHSKTNHK